ncbi:MAG TPA: zinc-binding alcohol dehydrogenase [Polyangiaceae bacterium]|nr:zinc-binding alcohol dehydrogenase [Polyangiaceae bacterium]
MSLRELWFVAPEQVELRAAPSAPLLPGQLRLRALASGISQGTELLLYRGEGPTPFDPSLDAPGAPTFPRRYGYAWVGEITESNSAAHAVGTRVFALLPHGDEHRVNAAQVRPLPEELPAERGVLAANLETAVNVVWDAAVALGDDVLVIGGGVVGLLTGHLAKLSGARRVLLVEPSAVRRRAALRLGFDDAWSPAQLPAISVDVVIEASGNPACLDLAIASARLEGVIVVASFYGERAANIALGADFHRRRLTLRASQVSRLPPGRSAGWSFSRRFELVVDLLKNPALDALLERPVPFDEAPSIYARLARAPGETLQMLFRYG